MPFCPECSGQMLYDRGSRLYVCSSCGCAMNQQELLEWRERNRAEREKKGREDRKREEYLEWWLSSKK